MAVNEQRWQDLVTDAQATKVFLALDDPKYTWRTAKAIARQTGLAESKVWEVVKTHPKLLRMSRTPSVTGDPLVGLMERVGD